VHHPIWAPVWDTTVTWLEGARASLGLDRFVEPRLEPEIVFGLGSAPRDAGPEAVFDCIEWVAHGFEIVQSPFAGWKFTAAEAIAVQALHGALLVGPRQPRACLPDRSALERFTLSLGCDGKPVATGSGDLVLGSPLLALCHLVSELTLRGAVLPAGAIVTTGTLTDAQPLKPGQRWESALQGLPLPGLTLQTL
jgi:2-oxo-3-hexenedioate decarboxylase